MCVCVFGCEYVHVAAGVSDFLKLELRASWEEPDIGPGN